MIKISGWDTTIWYAGGYEHNGTSNQNDYGAFTHGIYAERVLIKNGIEIGTQLKFKDVEKSRVLMHVSNSAGEEDWTDLIITPQPGAVIPLVLGHRAQV